MKVIQIQEKLEELEMKIGTDIMLGDFDYIGEFTAKKHRTQGTDLYNNAGCFFRPNYERGVLIYSLIRKYNLSSFLEVGFGRGYSTFCAAKAFADQGIKGNITTIDPNFNQEFLQQLTQVFPVNWWEMISFKQGKSSDELPKLDTKFDLVVLDGDHSESGVRSDWEMTKDRFNNFLIFDDYHLPPKSDPGIQVTPVVDSIEGFNKEAIIMDRRIFVDDRKQEEILDAQVLISK